MQDEQLMNPQIWFDAQKRTIQIRSNGSLVDIYSPKKIINIESSRQLQLTDIGNILLYNLTTTGILTIPNDSILNAPIPSEIEIIKENTGDLTIVGATGVNVKKQNVTLPGILMSVRYSEVKLRKIAQNEWRIYD